METVGSGDEKDLNYSALDFINSPNQGDNPNASN